MTRAEDFGAIVGRLAARLDGAWRDDASGESVWREAAVALVLRANLGAAELLVIKRADDPRDHWSGHLALPGGRRDPGDPDLSFTAVRETLEEVGIDLNAGGRVLGRLETLRPRSPRAPQMAVTPYVAVAPPAYDVSAGGEAAAERLTLSSEVEAAFWVPVRLLQQNGPCEVYRLAVEDEEREWPAYSTDYGLIWGLTERILTGFLRLIAD